MGSLLIQLGQCGCQIGSLINENLANTYYMTRQRKPNKLHAIMVDTQPKVLQPLINKPPTWLDIDNIKYFQHGRGNNWSYGYLHQIPQKKIDYNNNIQETQSKGVINGFKRFSHKLPNTSLISLYFKQNKQICDYVLDRARKELQTIDCAMSVGILSSLGGGTGSGLGTKIVEMISDTFNLDIHTHVILPNKSGETPLQVYNCALSLASMQQNSEAIFTYENDNMIEMFQGDGSLNHINKHIAQNISNLIKINELKYDKFYHHMVDDCIIGKQLNYLNLYSGYGKNSEDGFQNLFQQIRIVNRDDQFFDYEEKLQLSKRLKCLSHCLLVQSSQLSEFQIKYQKKFKALLNSIDPTLNYQEIKLSSKKKHGHQSCLITNTTNIARYLGYLVHSGRKKLQAGAYTWHYQYVDLGEAFNSIQNTIDQYRIFADKGY